MKIKELIEVLEGFDPEMKVIIGMVQRYGTDFAMEIEEVSVNKVEFWNNHDDNCVVITEGNKIGGVCYEDEDEDEDY